MVMYDPRTGQGDNIDLSQGSSAIDTIKTCSCEAYKRIIAEKDAEIEQMKNIISIEAEDIETIAVFIGGQEADNLMRHIKILQALTGEEE